VADCNESIPNDEIRVAVIAVHGVGDHVPNETARSVADILVNLNRSSETQDDLEAADDSEGALFALY
jgi:hypothetical protein